MPSEFILSKYLNVNMSACEENGSTGATFHGLLGPQDLKRKGNIPLPRKFDFSLEWGFKRGKTFLG